jgi:hypothetical protein
VLVSGLRSLTSTNISCDLSLFPTFYGCHVLRMCPDMSIVDGLGRGVTGTVRDLDRPPEERPEVREWLCREVVGRLEVLPRDMLAALLISVLTECERRGAQRRTPGHYSYRHSSPQQRR